MTGRVVCMANLKGGVGKTTASIMLAEGLSLMTNADGRPNRILVVDTDPQANLSYSFIGFDNLVNMVTNKKGINAMLLKKLLYGKDTFLKNHVQKDVSHVYGQFQKKRAKTNISLLPCTPDAIMQERRLLVSMTKGGSDYAAVAAKVFGFVKEDILAAAREEYDWVIVDCAPGINMLSQAFISAGDATVIVTVPETLPIFGLDIFVSAVWNEGMQDAGFPKPRNPMVLVNRYVRTQSSHKHNMDRLLKAAAQRKLYKLLNVVIPESSVLKKDGFFQMAISSLMARYAKANGEIVKTLAKEIEENVDARDD